MTRQIVIDTGPIVAVLGEESNSAKCADVFSRLAAPPLTSWPVITEACWLLRARPSAMLDVLDLIVNKAIVVAEFDATDVQSIRAFMQRYQSIGVQLADASLVRLADREKIDTVFTLDRRDFSVYRISTGKALKIVPEQD